MDHDMASAFASGSGFDASSMKAAVLALTGSAMLLLTAWLIQRLFHAYMNDEITPAQVLVSALWVCTIVVVMIAFLGLY